MARRKRADEERSMDSLMDAMTNVVGILLLILIVSSLGITAAVRQVVESLPEVTQEELEALKVDRDQTLRNLEELRQTHTNNVANLPSEEDAQTLMAELEELEESLDDTAANDIPEWIRKVEEQEALKEQNEEKVLVADARNRELAAILAQTPEREIIPAKDVVMPNPRVADEEYRALYLVCKHGRLYFVGDPYEHAFAIRDAIDQNFSDLAYTGGAIGSYTYPVRGTRRDDNGNFITLTERYRLSRRDREALSDWASLVPKWTNRAGVASGDTNVVDRIFGSNDQAELSVQRFRYDINKITAFFGEGKLGPRDFAYHVSSSSGDRVKMALEMKEDGGWTPEEFLDSNSDFTEACRQASLHRRTFLYYYVAPDSFDTYLQARGVSERFRIPAGWTIWEGDKLEPRAIPTRDQVRFNLSNLPTEDYRRVADAMGPAMVEQLNSEFAEFDQRVAAAVPEEMTEESEREEFISKLTAERRAWNVSRFQPWTLAIFQAALAAERASGETEIGVEVHPPDIPHIRVFTAQLPPEAPRPVEVIDRTVGEQGSGGDRDVGGTRIILD